MQPAVHVRVREGGKVLWLSRHRLDLEDFFLLPDLLDLGLDGSERVPPFERLGDGGDSGGGGGGGNGRRGEQGKAGDVDGVELHGDGEFVGRGEEGEGHGEEGKGLGGGWGFLKTVF